MNEELSSELENLRSEQADLKRRVEVFRERLEEFERKLGGSELVEDAGGKERDPLGEERVVLPPPLPPVCVEPPAVPQEKPFVPVHGEAVGSVVGEGVVPPALPQFDQEVEVSDGAKVLQPLGEPAAPEIKLEEEVGESLEMRLGRVWLVRLGMLVLLTGLVFLGNYAYREFVGLLGAAGRLTLIYLAALALGGLGAWLARAKGMVNYGRVLVAGGLATGYYATFAAHFVEPLRVVGSPLVGGVLLLGYALGVLGMADRTRSRLVAVATLALAFYTSAINPLSGFSLYGNGLLAVVALVLMLRHGWRVLEPVALLGTYGAFSFWRFVESGALFTGGFSDSGAVVVALAFPAVYWALFTVCAMVRRPVQGPQEGAVFLQIANNAAFYLLTAPVVNAHFAGALWSFTLLYGLVLLTLGVVATQRGVYGPAVEVAWLLQGLFLIPLGVALRITGYELSMALALNALVLTLAGPLRHGVILRGFGVAVGVVAAMAAVWGLLSTGPSAGGAFVTAALLAVCVWVPSAGSRQSRFSATSMAFSLLSLGVAALQMLAQFEGSWGTVWLALLGLAACGLSLVQDRREFAVGGHVVLFFAYLAFVARAEDMSVWTSLLMVSVAYALGARPWRLSLEGPREVLQLGHAVSAVALALYSLDVLGSGGYGSAAVAGISLLTLGVGLLGRSTPMVAVAALPAMLAGWLVLLAITNSDPLLPTAIAALLFVAHEPALRLFERRMAGPLAPAARPSRMLIRGWSAVLLIATVFFHVPAEWRTCPLAAAAIAAFLASVVTLRREGALYAGMFLLLCMGQFLYRTMMQAPAFLPDLVAFVAGIGVLHASKVRMAESGWFAPQWRIVVFALMVFGFWRTAALGMVEVGLPSTVAWSLVAFAVLGAGFPMRERTLRLLGLFILGASVARVFLMDVWQLETLLRIASFLVLGVVLLAIGFLYNRFQNEIRRWL